MYPINEAKMDKEGKDDYLDAYKKYLEELANNQSSALFANAGKEHASILMSLLFNHTVSDVRIFCVGFRPLLIRTMPYWRSLNNYLKDNGKSLKVLVETDDFLNDEPLQLLKKVKKKRADDSIVVKQITKVDQMLINEKVEGNHCNFAIFDNNKFRFEYDPDGFKAYGSFNRPENCRYLIDIFDTAFNNSNTVLV